MKFKTIFLFVYLLGFYYFTLAQDTNQVKLPPPQKDIGKPLMQALNLRQSSRTFDSKPLPIQDISNLLWAAFGVNRTETNKRTAPSSRDWKDIDIYVFLAEGVYTYSANEHTLVPVSNEDLRGMTGVQDFVKTAPLNLVYVSDQSKMGKASDEDKLITSGADAGFIAQNVYLYCASQDLAVVVRASIDKKSLAQKLNLKPGQKIILAQTIGYKK